MSSLERQDKLGGQLDDKSFEAQMISKTVASNGSKQYP